MANIRVLTFNCEWREATHPHGQEIVRRVLALDPDIVCLTEAHHDYLPAGHEIVSRAHDPKRPTRRKVLLWSKEPWFETDDHGHPAMLEGRYLGASTRTAVGDVRVHGVVIPYRFQDASIGRPAWSRHLDFLAGLDQLLPDSPRPTLLLGDFNQRVPRKYQPQTIFEALEKVVLRRLLLASGGRLPPLGKQAIDHICHSHEFQAIAVSAISNLTSDGKELSDHFGVFASFDAKRSDGK